MWPDYTVGKRFCPPQGGVNYNGDWCIGDTWVDYERKICSFGQDEFYSLDNLEQALHLSDRVAPMDKSKIIWCSYGAKHRELGEFLGIYGEQSLHPHEFPDPHLDFTKVTVDSYCPMHDLQI